jgi:Cu(I)/Ag(I) efflux system periplasmic protein CusF
MNWREHYTAHSMQLLHLLLLLALATPVAQAQTSPAPATPASSASTRQLPLARGEVIEVNRQDRSVLVKHGPIPSLGMDPMTMEFLVPDAQLLARLAPGTRIRFDVLWKDGDYVITRAEVLEPRARRRHKPAAPRQ